MQVTPPAVAMQEMKSSTHEPAFESVVEFLNRKNCKHETDRQKKEERDQLSHINQKSNFHFLGILL